MIPGVLLCVRIEQFMLAAMLASASVASSVYHLCDTDVYCVGGLTFLSLQVSQDSILFYFLCLYSFHCITFLTLFISYTLFYSLIFLTTFLILLNLHQIFDILFSALCMIAVIIYHSPNQKKYLPCYMIIFVAIFISPISNNPTDPQNMVSALVLSTTSCFFSWVYHFMGKKVRADATDKAVTNSNGGLGVRGNDDDFDVDDDLKNPRLEMRRFSIFSEKTGNPYNYSQVDMNEDMSRTELLSEEAGKAGEHEGESEVENDGRRESNSSSNNNNNSNSNSSSSSSSSRRGEMEMEGAYGSPGRGLENKSCRKKTFSEIASELRLTIIGENPYICNPYNSAARCAC